jgi:predicted Co/Zn/Cd cation transporter (cation efflux family)
MANRRTVLLCLIGLLLALLVVGVVSGTLLRHIVQVAPIAAAAAMVNRRPQVAAYAALPIFLFWTLICILIWLFLLGLSRIANGHYTPIEVASTFVMATCCGVGVVGGMRLGRPLPVLRRLLVFTLFLALQFGFMLMSFLQPIANR